MKEKPNYFALFILIFSIFSSYGQENKKPEEAYLSYFKLPRETLFLHTNKTTYLIGEDIWFKAYSFDRKNELTSKTSTNIYLGLYDRDGAQIDKKLYLGKDGAAIGNFELDSLLPSGEYFLKISTNWMKNFREDDTYVQKIQVINPKVKRKEEEVTNAKEYDFQFLPEGGNILVDVKNNIGIKVTDDKGKGTECSGVILNMIGEEVTQFKSNSLGIGKFSFIPKSGETYTAKVILDNSKEFEQKLPELQKIGVGIRVNNMRKDHVVITLSMNEASWELLKLQTFKLLLHKDGKVKPISVEFDKSVTQIVIAKKDLFRGVNTITLFNNKNKPILERLFFNQANGFKNYNFYLSDASSAEDSIAFKLKTDIALGESVLNASISVLPTGTRSYNPDHNIISAILLRPYVNGVIENPQYYFNNFDRRKQFELDALLLTQGWSRYSWDQIFNSPPKPTFDFENGISVNGFVNKNIQKINSLFLYPTALNASVFINIDEEGKFVINNFYPLVDEEIRLSYMNNKGKTKQPKMSLSFIKLMDSDMVDTRAYRSFSSYYKNKKGVLNQFIIDDSYEELDEIQIKTNYKKRLREEMRDPILVNGKVTKITREIALQYRNILDFIQNNGYDVFYGDGVIARLGEVVITSRTRGTRGKPVIFWDNIPITNFDFLSTLTTDQVERIVIDRTGVGLGISANSQNFGGAIKIFSRKGVLDLGNGTASNSSMFIHKVDYGFEPIKEFYTPKYASYRSQSFRDFGVIHWEPNINIEKGISDEFKMLDTGLDEINFYIEGVSSDGTVFSQLVKLETSDKE